jgi:hypothetical protein
LEGKLGKFVVFAASRYHGPITWLARPVVRMYTQLAEQLTSLTVAYVGFDCVPVPRLQVVDFVPAVSAAVDW